MTFPRGWYSFDLDDYRPCGGTYDLYPIETLPPLDPALWAGDYAWLPKSGRPRKEPKALGLLVAALAAHGRTLPADFLSFMADPRLGLAVPSCTACEWDLIDHPVPSPVEKGAWIIRFYRDQQDCLFWCLYLPPEGDAYVICTPIPLEQVDEPAEVVLANTWWVAPSFAAFVYRWWLENVLWDKLSDGEELTAEEAAYCAFCKAAGAGAGSEEEEE